MKKKLKKIREKEKESKRYIENTSMNKKIQVCTGIKAAGINYATIRAPNQFFIYIKVLYWKKEKKKEKK